MFSVERDKIMIKDEQQRTATGRGRVDSRAKGVAGPSKVRARQNSFKYTSKVPTRRNVKPVEKNVSRQVLNVVDRMMKEYQSDLEYLKDK